MDEPIGTTELLCVRGDDQELRVAAAVGKPYERETDEWACPVALDGMYGYLPDVVGNDSLQALCLAASLLRQLLEEFVEGGGRIYCAGATTRTPDQEFPIEAVFSRVGDGGRSSK